jgi:uncharacterized membrane protein
MFATIGHTFGLMKMSWRVLMKDRELIWFPIMAGAILLVVVGIAAAIGASTGTFDRLENDSANGQQANAGDIILGVVLYTIATFVIIFFNSALIAAALERLRGGDPSVSSGFRAALAHIHTIAVWALIAATVGLILQMLRSRTDSFIGRIAIALVGGAWAYMTFFVVPVLVTEGIGPIEAIKRSGSLFRRTWGQQAVSGFGFGIVYIGAALVALLPSILLFAIMPVLGVIVAVPLFAIAIGTVMALEGIFKAALFEFANDRNPLEFDRQTLSSAYRAL